MVYYNDQIMDNLIRAKNRLPFVHVDITLLTSQGGSQISGTIGAGEIRTNTNTSKSMAAGALGTIANAVMRPFAYSVTPQQTETLTISTAPALGSQAVAAPEETQSPKVQITKWTESTEKTRTYPTPSATPSPTPSSGIPSAGTQSAGALSTVKVTTTAENQPTQRTIYDLYESFADRYVKFKVPSLTRPNKDDVLPGTVIKLWGGYYYYIDKSAGVNDAYYKFCRALFTKGQPGLLGSSVQQGLAAPLAVPTFR